MYLSINSFIYLFVLALRIEKKSGKIPVFAIHLLFFQKVLPRAWSFGVQLVVFFCSGISGISMCHNTMFLSSPHL